MKLTLIALPAVMAFLMPSGDRPIPLPVASSEMIVGKARPTDGDSLRIGAKAIRLYGIDAVEGRQVCQIDGQDWDCGRASRKALERATKGRVLSCEVRDMDRGRYVSVCTADGVDINEDQVRRGWAVAYRRFSSVYVGAETDARRSKRGIWRGQFETPHDYRARLRREAAAKIKNIPPPSADCAIKGNISRSGTRIYHRPGQADYDRTSINEAQGEKWFCTTADAEASGWRAAKR